MYFVCGLEIKESKKDNFMVFHFYLSKNVDKEFMIDR